MFWIRIIRHASMLALIANLLTASACHAADWSLDENPQLAQYFETQVAAIEARSSLFNFQTLQDWEAARPRLRQQLFDQLGLNPLPARTPLEPQVTGVVDGDGFVVEKLHFQSLPGLYVTANFYRPKNATGPLPAVLYVCGHALVKDGGVSFGNKTAYHHHGSWFARNGYCCLTIDTLQLGEIEGIHHGTYREGRWWWNSRGYTPAGVEAWNCMRALDYLETRPEVDAARFGVTGRSGGGVYSWWITALDDRIRCAVPVAGITTLRNYVVDGCVEGHCDCMFMVNTNRWDYAMIAALAAPRPLLISNSDKDTIFPLDGVVEVHRQVRHIYDLYEKPGQLGLQITEGPHKDTQELRVHAFRWMNRWLKDDDSLIEQPAVKFFEPAQLRVFTDLPADQRNTSIDEDFVAQAADPSPGDFDVVLNNQQQWFDDALAQLRSLSFAAWPDNDREWKPANDVRAEAIDVPFANAPEKAALTVTRLHFESQQHVPLFMDVVSRGSSIDDLSGVTFLVADDAFWQSYHDLVLNDNAAPAGLPESIVPRLLKETEQPGSAVAIFSPRGVGPHLWNGDEKKQIQIRRRFQLIGATADGMRVWDIRRAIQLARQKLTMLKSLRLSDTGSTGQLLLMASLFEPAAEFVVLKPFSASREQQAVFLNAARFTNPATLTALAAHHAALIAERDRDGITTFATRLAADRRWTGQQIVIESP